MQVSSEIIKVLDYLCQKLGITIDWTSSNILPYFELLCKKYVNYEIATSVVWAIVGIIFLVVAGHLFKKFKFYSDIENEDYDIDFALVFLTISSFIFLPAFIIVLAQVLNIVTCLTLPEKQIIEELIDIKNSIK